MLTMPYSCNNTIRILGIVGSPKPESVSLKATMEVLNICEAGGVVTNLVDLRCLDFANLSYSSKEKLSIGEFQQMILEADALILSSPEQNNDYTDIFQRLFKLLEEKQSLKGKTVACIGVGSKSHVGGVRALVGLMEKTVQLKAWPISSSTFIPQNDLIVDRNRFVAFSQTAFQRLRAIGLELVFSVQQIRIKEY